MLVSYHTHTRWSDGQGEISDMIREARDLGLNEVGISDHYILTPDGKDLCWSMPADGLDDYVAEVQEAAGDAGEDLIVRLGVEVDFIPETAKETAKAIKSQPFDYVIGSVHIVDGFPIDENAEHWEKLTQSERDDMMRAYWVRVRKMAESGMFDFAAHLDLNKKFGFRPSVDLSSEISAALDAIASADMAFEINTAGLYWPSHEEYPAPSIIEGCLKRNIPLVISSDAHTPENLVRGFEDAYRLAQNIGYRTHVSYAGRMRMLHPLDEF